MRALTIILNDDAVTVDATASETLLDVLRTKLGITSAKRGCDGGECGACTVLLDGRPVNACLVLALTVDRHRVTTVEGLGRPERLHPLQRAFHELGAVQCGFCTPGMLLTAKALLDEIPNPGADDVRAALAGNLCRCTGYVKPIQAIMVTALTTETSGDGTRSDRG